MLSVATSSTQWQRDVALTGFFDISVDVQIRRQRLRADHPAQLTQPELTLPFARGEWVYTGGNGVQ